MSNVQYFVKKYWQILVYALAGIITVAIIVPMLIWVFEGDKATEVRVESAKIVYVGSGEMRSEYLVNQTFDVTDMNLITEGDNALSVSLADENCILTYDFSSGGEKTVTVVYKADSYLSYSAEIRVNVLFVRSIAIENYPDYISFDENGTPIADENLSICATLGEKPSTSIFGEIKETSGGYNVKLNENFYTVSCVGIGSLANYYDITYHCGNASVGFSFYNSNGRSYKVTSSKDIVQFESNAAEGDNTSLELIVTQRDDTYRTVCTGKTLGYYIYTDKDGNGKEINFGYELKDKREVFWSSDVTETTSRSYGTAEMAYTVEYGGYTFTPDTTKWQSAVVNGQIIEDHGFLIVLGDVENRKLTLEYQTTDEWGNVVDGAITDESAAKPTLTLYIADYSLDPKLGTGSGYSRGVYIYTTADGKRSYKLPFTLEAYTWTYVPSSARNQDKSSAVYVDWDYTFNPSASSEKLWYDSYFIGSLYVRLSVFEEQSDSSNSGGNILQYFMATQENWLKPVINL